MYNPTTAKPLSRRCAHANTASAMPPRLKSSSSGNDGSLPWCSQPSSLQTLSRGWSICASASRNTDVRQPPHLHSGSLPKPLAARSKITFMTCSRTSGAASGTNFRSSCTVAQSAIWGQACPVQLTGASIFCGPSPQRRSGSRLVRRWRRVFEEMGTWQGAVTPGMPGGGPRYRSAMALLGSPFFAAGLRAATARGRRSRDHA
mmetsp:Transcript_15087/g.42876  ORF Transcript_15087/g.42876 Transcript_15087/m.42876 type:complete len:203 (-) Transcript_15087:44-652(-)